MTRVTLNSRTQITKLETAIARTKKKKKKKKLEIPTQCAFWSYNKRHIKPNTRCFMQRKEMPVCVHIKKKKKKKKLLYKSLLLISIGKISFLLFVFFLLGWVYVYLFYAVFLHINIGKWTRQLLC